MTNEDWILKNEYRKELNDDYEYALDNAKVEIEELQQENERLKVENETLKRMVEGSTKTIKYYQKEKQKVIDWLKNNYMELEGKE